MASMERTVVGRGGEETKTPKRREEDFVGSAADFVYAVREKSVRERWDSSGVGGGRRARVENPDRDRLRGRR